MNRVFFLNGVTDIDDFLFQILIILVPIFVYQMFWLEKLGIEASKQRKYVLLLFCAGMITLCMLFPIDITPEHRYDLRLLPITLGFLYLGNRQGILLAIFGLLLRICFGGILGIYHATLIFVFYIPILFFTRKIFIVSNRNKRTNIILLLSLYSFGCFLAASFPDNFIFKSPETTRVFIEFLIVSFITSWISLFLIESMRENYQIKLELQQAEKTRLLSDISGVFAHEIRNPMQVTRGFLQLLNDPELPPKKKEFIQLSIEELDRANGIINDFLTFAKPPSDNHQEVNVSYQLRRVASLIQTYSISKNVAVRTNISDSCLVYANPQKLSQCLINILKNAIESMPNGGDVLVSCTANGDGYIEITIQDKGIGMTKEQIDKLGSPFYSLKENGTGLGMMVSFQIIRSFEGEIKIHSQLGLGTTFKIFLPQIN